MNGSRWHPPSVQMSLGSLPSAGCIDCRARIYWRKRRPPRRQWLFPNQGSQVSPIDIIHHQEVLPVVNPNFMNGPIRL
jgi:hypothetical protein